MSENEMRRPAPDTEAPSADRFPPGTRVSTKFGTKRYGTVVGPVEWEVRFDKLATTNYVRTENLIALVDATMCDATLVSESNAVLFECDQLEGHRPPHTDKGKRWTTSPDTEAPSEDADLVEALRNEFKAERVYNARLTANLAARDTELAEARAEVERHKSGFRLRDLSDENTQLRAEIERQRSWEGLMSLLDEKYPADIWTGSSGDPGPTIVALTRELGKARAEVERLRDMNRSAESERNYWGDRCDHLSGMLRGMARRSVWWRRSRDRALGLCEAYQAENVGLSAARDRVLALCGKRGSGPALPLTAVVVRDLLTGVESGE